LLSTESLTGAQRLQYQMQSSSVEERRVCAMNNNFMQSPQSSALTVCAIDRDVKLPSPAKVNDCLTVCRCEEVIKRCDSGIISSMLTQLTVTFLLQQRRDQTSIVSSHPIF